MLINVEKSLFTYSHLVDSNTHNIEITLSRTVFNVYPIKYNRWAYRFRKLSKQIFVYVNIFHIYIVTL